ncbi:MAG TPA: hypothetical protein VIV60_34845, partial [Polyangiaceae bacterium]
WSGGWVADPTSPNQRDCVHFLPVTRDAFATGRLDYVARHTGGGIPSQTDVSAKRACHDEPSKG